MRDSTSRERVVVGAVLVVATALAFQPSWHRALSGEDFPGHLALLTRLLERLGEPDWLPLWTSDLAAGTSLLTPYLHPIGSLLLLSPFAVALGPELGLRVGDTVFLALAALSMLAWCRSLGASPLAGYLGGLFYALHPMVFVFVGRAGQVHQPVTMALLPLVFLSFRRLAQRPDATRLALAALATAALALDMQRFWLVLPFALAGCLATDGPRPETASARLANRVAWGAAVGLGAALLVCFPALPALFERAQLMGHPEETLLRYRQSFSIPHLLALLDRDGGLASHVEGARAAHSGILAGSAYQGIAPLLLVSVGVGIALRARRQAARRAAIGLVTGAAGAVILLAMGTRAALAQHVRIASEFVSAGVGPLAWLALIAVLLLGALALGATLAGARERWPQWSPWLVPAIALLALASCATAPFAWLAHLPIYSEVRGPAHFAFPMLPFLLGTAASLVLPVFGQRRTQLLAIAAGATLLHGIDLLPYREALRPTRTSGEEQRMRMAYRKLATAPDGRVATSQDYDPLGESLALLEAERPAAWSWIAWSARADTADLLRPGGFDSLGLAVRLPDRGAAEFAARVFGLANVRYLVRSGPDVAPLPDAPVFARWHAEAGVEIFENQRALPFAQFYPRLALVSGTRDEQLDALVELAYAGVAVYALAPGGRPPGDLRFDYAHGTGARTRAPRAPGIYAISRSAPPSHSPCEIARRREPEIVLHCHFSQDGHLVVAESWSPDWHALVDGEPRPLHRLNLAFQGLRVSPGDREIRLRHEASALTRASLAVSLAAWTGLAGFGAWRWRCSPAPTRAEP